MGRGGVLLHRRRTDFDMLSAPNGPGAHVFNCGDGIGSIEDEGSGDTDRLMI